MDSVAVGERSIKYDARGLVEPDAEPPRTSEIAGGRAVFDATGHTTRTINLEIRWLLTEKGVKDITVRNPGAKHSIGVAILERCRLRFEGSLGYFGVGLIDGPEVEITGRVGWSVAENMMSGTVVIEKNAGSLAGAAIRGGDLVVKGDVGARTGIDQKGGTIIAGGNAGLLTGFMMQRGRQIICGDVGPGLGDSMYDGAIFVGGKVASLGVDCEEAEVTEADAEMLAGKLGYYGIESPGTFKKFVCARKLWNYDSLEPNERKLVL
jgi:glutamate synthase domain-containing protein 3